MFSRRTSVFAPTLLVDTLIRLIPVGQILINLYIIVLAREEY